MHLDVDLDDIKLEKQDCQTALNYFKNMKKTNNKFLKSTNKSEQR